MPTPTPHQRALAEILRALRAERGVPQEWLAEQTNLSRNYIGMVERAERNPSFNALWAIAGALDLPCSQLVADVERQLDLDVHPGD